MIKAEKPLRISNTSPYGFRELYLESLQNRGFNLATINNKTESKFLGAEITDNSYGGEEEQSGKE